MAREIRVGLPAEFFVSTGAQRPFRRLSPGLLLLLLLGFAALLGAACRSSLDLSPVERQAQAVDRSLICPVCPGETIDQSRVELARQMRALVREKLAAGWTKEQVQQFFVERYGPGVLSAPPQRGFNVVAWTVPPLALILGSTLLWLALRSLTRSPAKAVQAAAPSPAKQDAEELKPYLAQVDTLLDAQPDPNRKWVGRPDGR